MIGGFLSAYIVHSSHKKAAQRQNLSASGKLGQPILPKTAKACGLRCAPEGDPISSRDRARAAPVIHIPELPGEVEGRNLVQFLQAKVRSGCSLPTLRKARNGVAGASRQGISQDSENGTVAI